MQRIASIAFLIKKHKTYTQFKQLNFFLLSFQINILLDFLRDIIFSVLSQSPPMAINSKNFFY